MSEPEAPEAMPPDATPVEILTFWAEAGPEKWFAHDPDFDAEIERRFAPTHFKATVGTLTWGDSLEEIFALIILLDQFTRNLYRGTHTAYRNDVWARHNANNAIRWGYDKLVEGDMRMFFYMPYQHSEDLGDQEWCVAAFREHFPHYLKYAEEHRDIIARFGRFPHRNAVLGRESTPEEIAFLENGGFAG